LDEIVDQAEKAGYEETFRRGRQIVTMKKSVQWHLDRMVNGRQVLRDSV
jgi:predicted component of type VI protein secretion system